MISYWKFKMVSDLIGKPHYEYIQKGAPITIKGIPGLYSPEEKLFTPSPIIVKWTFKPQHINPKYDAEGVELFYDCLLEYVVGYDYSQYIPFFFSYLEPFYNEKIEDYFDVIKKRAEFVVEYWSGKNISFVVEKKKFIKKWFELAEKKVKGEFTLFDRNLLIKEKNGKYFIYL